MASPCKACGTPIVFVRTAKRSLMPVDANLPVENALDADATLTFSELVAKLGREKVVSHFVTCPEAERFRGQKP